MELSDKTVVDYIGFFTEVFFIISTKVIFITIKHFGKLDVSGFCNIRLFKIWFLYTYKNEVLARFNIRLFKFGFVIYL